MSPPFDARWRTYSPNERRQIDPFKAEYMMTTTPAQRKVLAQAHIFPALFSYWSETGINLNPEEKNKRSEVSKCIYLVILL